jgi:mitogen-activated protein kinase kinase
VPATTSTGTGGSETLTTSTSGGSSNRKKSSTSIGGKKKSKTDKDGLELVRDEDLEILEDLGAGNGGTVTKVWNKKRNCVMARKVRRDFERRRNLG